MRKHIGKIVTCTVIILVFFATQFGAVDYLRKNLFPNERDKIEAQFFESFNRDESEVISPISWGHPGNSKERVAFIARLNYQGDDFNAYVLENVKFYLDEIQTQKLLSEKYDGMAFWIAQYLPDKDYVGTIISFYIDKGTLYETDWSGISNEELWDKIGIP